MFREPITNLLFHNIALIYVEAARQFSSTNFAGIVPIGTRQDSPEIRLAHIFGNAGSIPVVGSQNRLGFDLATVRSEQEPARRLCIVLLDLMIADCVACS